MIDAMFAWTMILSLGFACVCLCVAVFLMRLAYLKLEREKKDQALWIASKGVRT